MAKVTAVLALHHGKIFEVCMTAPQSDQSELKNKTDNAEHAINTVNTATTSAGAGNSASASTSVIADAGTSGTASLDAGTGTVTIKEHAQESAATSVSASHKGKKKESLSDKVNRDLSLKEQMALTLSLSMPSILAQFSSICMQYIDAAMVGSLGATASASIGLMAAPVWLFTGICISSCSGFSVQVAHLLGGRDDVRARTVMRQGYVVLLIFACIVALIACALSDFLPVFLGGSDEIVGAAGDYFFIFMAALPFFMLSYLSSAMLRCSGNMLLPSLLNILMCVLDVIFNFFFIFESRTMNLPVVGTVEVYGAGLGVVGAALGTVCAAGITGLFMAYFLIVRSPALNILQDIGVRAWSFKPTWDVVRRALRISLPISAQQFMISSAQIVSTMIVAPLGTASIAAHSFAITIEAICYMPGFGIADAATTLVGQSIGARRFDLTYRFAKITLGFGAAIMAFMGMLMYIFSPWVMSLMTPDLEVQQLAVAALRIEAFAEPLFAASIIGYGICVGAGDTLIPSLMNLGSMWIVRLTMAYFLAAHYGLRGVWIAMALELSFRGLIFLARLKWSKWIKTLD